MRDESRDDDPIEQPRGDDWRLPAAIGVTILISLVAFIVLFLALDPYFRGLTSGPGPVSPAAVISPANDLTAAP